MVIVSHSYIDQPQIIVPFVVSIISKKKSRIYTVCAAHRNMGVIPQVGFRKKRVDWCLN
jgi:hypothetical protein